MCPSTALEVGGPISHKACRDGDMPLSFLVMAKISLAVLGLSIKSNQQGHSQEKNTRGFFLGGG